MNIRELNRIDRRTALKRALWTSLGGAIAYNELALGPSLQSLFNRLMLATYGQSLDARYLLAEAMRGGPATFRWSAAEALAATGAPDWSVVHIKLVNHVSTNLVFRLGQVDGQDETKTVNGSDRSGQDLEGGINVNPIIFSKIANAQCMRHLAQKGLGRLSGTVLGLTGTGVTDTTYGKMFRMNGWFADILHNPVQAVGKRDDGTTTMYSAAMLSGAGVFDHNKVGLQVALGMKQTRGGNHALANLKIRANLPDFGYYLENKKILQSPLGISAFMMGEAYDKAEGQQPRNVVIGAFSDAETAVVDGVSVATHTNSIIQSVSAGELGYIVSSSPSAPPLTGNLTEVFDKLVVSDPTLRKEMEKSKQQFKDKVSALTSAAALETTPVYSQLADAKAVGSVQATGGGSPAANGAGDTNVAPARAEFLAQIQYTAKCIQLSGKPIRNFSLFLNMQDVDGGNVDTASFGDPGGLQIKCLSYVEGMRQLAIGLNILAGLIKEQHKILVLVTAEGGRNNNMSDSACSFGFVMGPKSDVPTRLYADSAAINQVNSPQVSDPGLSGAAHTYSSGIYFDPSGRGMSGTPVVGDLQAGAIRFLAEKMNSGLSLTELGNFIKIG